MNDWANIAKARGLDLSAQETDRIAKALAELNKTFEPLIAELTVDLEPASVFHMEEE
jgi:hypothetical protein